MSLSRPLKKEVRKELENDPFMSKCCVADETCKGRITWHHHLRYGGKRSDFAQDILPVCQRHHDLADTKLGKEKLDWVWLNRLNEAQIEKISKAINYGQRKKYLNQKYGKYIA